MVREIIKLVENRNFIGYTFCSLVLTFTTDSKLYDYLQCPHKVWRDVYGPMKEKIKEANPFVQFLWDRGVIYEQQVIANLVKYLELSKGNFDDRFKLTVKAMQQKILINLLFQFLKTSRKFSRIMTTIAPISNTSKTYHQNS